MRNDLSPIVQSIDSSPGSEFDMENINSEYERVSHEMQRFISSLVKQSTSVGYSIVVIIINVIFRVSINRGRRREMTAAFHGLSHHSLQHAVYGYISRNNRPSDTTFLLNFVLDTHIIGSFLLTSIFLSSVLRILVYLGITDWSMVFSMVQKLN